MDGGARVLVVDGKETEGDELLYLLESEGYRVDRVLSGGDALSRMVQGQFDLVLLELPLPDMDGLELIRQIRQANPDVAEIAMGDHLSLEAAIEGWRSDVSGYVPQPLKDPDEVLAAVAGGLADRRQELVPAGIGSQE